MAGPADAARALRELAEVSSQIEEAVIVDAAGEVVASTFGSDDDAVRVAAGASALLAAADERVGSERARVSHLVAEVDGGAVFVVRSDGGTIAAITGPEPTTGLVFYDLKVTLRDATAAPVAEDADA
jgi:predicted regulator of Ras-like GTPase activity (Roadblock/LC7/MglB family)